jgi:hypothetical protein
VLTLAAALHDTSPSQAPHVSGGRRGSTSTSTPRTTTPVPAGSLRR